MLNKHIKNRSTPFRWTSLTVGLLCGRYMHMKKILLLLFFLTFIGSCSKELPIVAEVPVLVGCENKVRAKIDEWNKNNQGTGIELQAELIEFTSRQAGESPVESYVRIKAGNTLHAPESYVNSIALDCLYTKVYKLEKKLAYTSGGSFLAEEFEGKGKVQATVKVEENKIKIYTTSDESI